MMSSFILPYMFDHSSSIMMLNRSYPPAIKHGLLENPVFLKLFSQRTKPPWLVRGLPIGMFHASGG